MLKHSRVDVTTKNSILFTKWIVLRREYVYSKWNEIDSAIKI